MHPAFSTAEIRDPLSSLHIACTPVLVRVLSCIAHVLEIPAPQAYGLRSIATAPRPKTSKLVGNTTSAALLEFVFPSTHMSLKPPGNRATPGMFRVDAKLDISGI